MDIREGNCVLFSYRWWLYGFAIWILFPVSLSRFMSFIQPRVVNCSVMPVLGNMLFANDMTFYSSILGKVINWCDPDLGLTGEYWVSNCWYHLPVFRINVLMKYFFVQRSHVSSSGMAENQPRRSHRRLVMSFSLKHRQLSKQQQQLQWSREKSSLCGSITRGQWIGSREAQLVHYPSSIVRRLCSFIIQYFHFVSKFGFPHSCIPFLQICDVLILGYLLHLFCSLLS